MASVRISESFFEHPIMRELRETKKSGMQADGQAVFIRMVCKCANGAEYRDAADLDNVGPKQAVLIWNVCIDNGALRRTPTGRFSLYEWMVENDLIIYDQTRRTRSKRFNHSTTVVPSEPVTTPAAPFVPPKDALVGEERAKYVAILKDIIGRKK